MQIRKRSYSKVTLSCLSLIGSAAGELGCSASPVDHEVPSAGSATQTAGGGPSAVVPSPGGGGGSPVVTAGNGGGQGTGGAPTVTTGGAPVGAGGAVVGNGGVPAPTGGVPAPTGGVPASGGSSSAGNPGAAGAAGTPAGCAQANYCMAADDLAPPDAGQGFQLVSPSSISVQPGGEGFYCYYKDVPATGDVNAGGFRSWMTSRSSHHFITYLVAPGGVRQPDGSLQQCTFGSGQWIYATSQSGLVIGMDMPSGVGLPLVSGAQLLMNMHLINTGDSPTSPVVKLNVLYAANIQYKAGAMTSFNTQINVQPGGTQTVSGTCTPPAGSNFFLMTTHTHRWATSADVDYVSGGQTTNIVHTTDYESPGTHLWQAPNFLTTKPGDTFTYSCSYRNTESFAITVGETASRNEMCMAIGYYFPQGNAPCR